MRQRHRQPKMTQPPMWRKVARDHVPPCTAATVFSLRLESGPGKSRRLQNLRANQLKSESPPPDFFLNNSSRLSEYGNRTRSTPSTTAPLGGCTIHGFASQINAKQWEITLPHCLIAETYLTYAVYLAEYTKRRIHIISILPNRHNRTGKSRRSVRAGICRQGKSPLRIDGTLKRMS